MFSVDETTGDVSTIGTVEGDKGLTLYDGKLYSYNSIPGGKTRFYELDLTTGATLQTVDIDWQFGREGVLTFREDEKIGQ